MNLGAPVKNNLSVVAGLVMVPTEDGVLHAIGLADGLEQWTYRPETSLAGPVASADLVYVTDGRGILHGLDVATGAVRWDGTEAVSSASAATVSDGSVYVGTSDGHVVAFDAETGVLRWETSVSPASEVIGSPAVGADLVFAASPTGGLVAIHAATGEVAWRFDTQGEPLGTVAYADGIVYVGTPSGDATGRLRAVDAATGQIRWVVDEPLFSPSVVGSLAISGSDVGVISARDVATGIERWRLQTGGVNRAPAIAGGIAFVAADTNRQVLAIDVATGQILWQLGVDGENQCCLAVAEGLVLAGTMNGNVHAIAGDGAPIIARNHSRCGVRLAITHRVTLGKPRGVGARRPVHGHAPARSGRSRAGSATGAGRRALRRHLRLRPVRSRDAPRPHRQGHPDVGWER